MVVCASELVLSPVPLSMGLGLVCVTVLVHLLCRVLLHSLECVEGAHHSADCGVPGSIASKCWLPSAFYLNYVQG
jgi:hypothetical protein